MQDQTQKLRAIRRLLGSFAETGGRAGETTEQRAERLALQTHNYLTAINGFDLVLINDGVDLIIRGELPGHDMRWAPTPPMLATACRMAADHVARRRYLDGITAPRLPAPEIVKTPEQRERAKAKIAEFVASQGPSVAEQHVNERDRAERLARHDDFFADDFIPTGGGVGRISKTLAKKLGYEVGSPESDDAAA